MVYCGKPHGGRHTYFLALLNTFQPQGEEGLRGGSAAKPGLCRGSARGQLASGVKVLTEKRPCRGAEASSQHDPKPLGAVWNGIKAAQAFLRCFGWIPKKLLRIKCAIWLLLCLP